MTTIPTIMCIAPDLDWQGRCTDHPVGVYCAVTLQLIGQSEPGVASQPDGTIRLRFAGVELIASPPATASRWWTLAAVDPAAWPQITVRRVEGREPGFVADGPDGHTWLLKRMTEQDARREGLTYFLATRVRDHAGRWVLA